MVGGRPGLRAVVQSGAIVTQPVAPVPPPAQPLVPARPAEELPPQGKVGEPQAFARCASCHSGAADKGGGFAFVGLSRPLSAIELLTINEKLKLPEDDKAVMPPAPAKPVSEDEIAEIQGWIGEQARALRGRK